MRVDTAQRHNCGHRRNEDRAHALSVPHPVREVSVVLLMLMVCACAGPRGPARDAGCVPGSASPCACGDGAAGASECGEDGTLGACVCDATRCAADAVRVCACADGAVGRQRCAADGRYEVCECVAADASVVCPGVSEACNGSDDDCDGVVDEGWVCATSGAANVVPFEGGVWAMGAAAGEPGISIVRVWPERGERRRVATMVRWLDAAAFRPDGVLFYDADGIFRDVEGDVDELVDTPPCWLRAGEPAFDAAGALHYTCALDLRRGYGEQLYPRRVDTSSMRVAAVLPSGAFVAHLQRTTGDNRLELASPSGAPISAIEWHDFDGWFSATGTAQGDSAWVGVRRQLGDGAELFVFRVDAAGTWSLVRRVEIPLRAPRALVLPDGSVVLVRENVVGDTGDDELVRLSPEGATEVLLRNHDGVLNVGFHTLALAGPR